jgi:hypothetical protein
LWQKIQKYKLCYIEKKHSYYSKECSKLEGCYPAKQVKLKFSGKQSPGFALCYQTEGAPFFGKVDGRTVAFCKKEGKIIDTDSLLRFYQKD